MDGQRRSGREGRGEGDGWDRESRKRRKMEKQAESRWNKRKEEVWMFENHCCGRRGGREGERKRRGRQNWLGLT